MTQMTNLATTVGDALGLVHLGDVHLAANRADSAIAILSPRGSLCSFLEKDNSFFEELFFDLTDSAVILLQSSAAKLLFKVQTAAARTCNGFNQDPRFKRNPGH